LTTANWRVGVVGKSKKRQRERPQQGRKGENHTEEKKRKSFKEKENHGKKCIRARLL